MTHPFVKQFNAVAATAYSTAIAKGFWKEEKDPGVSIALMHSELSEALEALRHGNPPDDKIPSFSGVEAELADCIIRIMDFAAAGELRVAEAILCKMEFNAGRPRLHGKRF